MVRRATWLLTALVLLVSPSADATTPQGSEVGELRQEVAAQWEAFDDRVDHLESNWRTAAAILAFLGLVTLAGYLHLMRRVKQGVEERIGNLIEGRSTEMAELIDRYSLDRRLQRESRLAVISERARVSGVLRDLGFERVRLLSPAEGTEHELATFSVVIFDSEGGVDDHQVLRFLDETPGMNAFVFAPGFSEVLKGKCAFANSEITLFGRLMEVLRYQAARKK